MFGALFLKEFKVEMRTPVAMAGILLHLAASVFILYLLVDYSRVPVLPQLWNGIFWVLILFIQVHAIGKGFLAQPPGLNFYIYSIAHPTQIIVVKMIYNFIVAFIFSVIALAMLLFVTNMVIHDYSVAFLVLALSSWGFSAALSLPAAIASQAQNSPVVMVILSFPVIITNLLLAMRATRVAMDPDGVLSAYEPLVTLFAVNLIITAISYLLFPYIWRS